MIDRLVNALRPYQFRGKLRLLDAFVPCEGTRRARVHGAEVELDLADLIQRQVFLGCYEPAETSVFKQILRVGSTVVDVGANVGYFTALANRICGTTGRVFAIEPSPYAFGRLQRLVVENGLSQVILMQVGLSDRDGELSLYVPSASSGNHTPTMAAAGGGVPVQVRVTTLDQCVDEWGVGTIDLMKVDVEGHEPRVLAGGERTARAGRIRNLLIEVNDYWLRGSGSSARDLRAQVAALGFREVARSGRPHTDTAIYTMWLQHTG